MVLPVQHVLVREDGGSQRNTKSTSFAEGKDDETGEEDNGKPIPEEEGWVEAPQLQANCVRDILLYDWKRSGMAEGTGWGKV